MAICLLVSQSVCSELAVIALVNICFVAIVEASGEAASLELCCLKATLDFTVYLFINTISSADLDT